MLCPPLGDLPDPGIKPTSPMSPALAGGFFTTSATWESPLQPQKYEVLVTQSCRTLCEPQTIAHQASLSMGFSRQEHWSGLSFPSPEDLPNPGIKPLSPALQAESLSFE